MNGMNLSFTHWPYPTKKLKRQLLSMSPSGLLAHTVDNIITIYTDNKNGYSPLITWAPFEHTISAICWYDATDIPEIAVPVIVIASLSKRICIFDLCAHKNITSFTLNGEQATVMKWSPISSSRFFIGTANGDFLCCSLTLDKVVKFSVDWTINLGFQVDFISFEPDFADNVLVASKSGQLNFVTNVHSMEPKISPENYSLCDENNEIYSCDFLDASSNYLIVVTKLGTILYTIWQQESFNLFKDMMKLRYLYPVHSHGGRFIGISNENMSLYEFTKSKVHRLSEIPTMPSVSNQTQAFQTEYIYKNEKIVYISYNWWLTTVKIIHDKLFVTSRVKLIAEKPVDYAFKGGSTLFCGSNGSIFATRSTPSAMIRKESNTDCVQSLQQQQSQQQNQSAFSRRKASNDKPKPSSQQPKKLTPKPSPQSPASKGPSTVTPTSTTQSPPSATIQTPSLSANISNNNSNNNNSNNDNSNNNVNNNNGIGLTSTESKAYGDHSDVLAEDSIPHANSELDLCSLDEGKAKDIERVSSQSIVSSQRRRLSNTSKIRPRSSTERLPVCNVVPAKIQNEKFDITIGEESELDPHTRVRGSNASPVDLIGGGSAGGRKKKNNPNIGLAQKVNVTSSPNLTPQQKQEQEQSQKEQKHEQNTKPEGQALPPKSQPKKFNLKQQNTAKPQPHQQQQQQGVQVQQKQPQQGQTQGQNHTQQQQQQQQPKSANSPKGKVMITAAQTQKQSQQLPKQAPQQQQQQQQKHTPSAPTETNIDVMPSLLHPASPQQQPPQQQDQNAPATKHANGGTGEVHATFANLNTDPESADSTQENAEQVPSFGFAPFATVSGKGVPPKRNSPLQFQLNESNNSNNSGTNESIPMASFKMPAMYQAIHADPDFLSNSHRQRSLSMHPNAIGDDNIKKIAESAKAEYLKNVSIASTTDDNSNEQPEYGNSRSIFWCFKLCDCPLTRTEWITNSKVFAYGTESNKGHTYNHLYVVDVRYRRVLPVLGERLNAINLPVTSVVLCDNKKICAVVLNETLVTFILLTSKVPRMVGSLNYDSKIVVCFSPNSSSTTTESSIEKACVVCKNVAHFIEIDSKNSSIHEKETRTFQGKKIRNITAAIWKRSSLVVGDVEGRLIQLAFDPFSFEEFANIKNEVVSIISHQSSSMIVVDVKGNTHVVTLRGIEASLPFPVKCIHSTSSTEFVVRGFGRGRLTALQFNGFIQPIYTPSTIRCMVMKPRNIWMRLLKDALSATSPNFIGIAEVFGMPLARKIIYSLENPDYMREQMSFVRDIVGSNTELDELTMHINLNLGESDKARSVALRTKSNDSKYLLNIFKSVMLKTAPNKDAVLEAVAQLFLDDFSDEAVELLLVFGMWKEAVAKLVDIGHFKEAMNLLKVRVEESEDVLNYLKELSKRLLDSDHIGAGLIVMALAGGMDEVVKKYKDLGEFEQAMFLEKLL